MNQPLIPPEPTPTTGLAIILAGGESRRFGTDKGNFKWKGRTFSAHIRQNALKSGLKVRVVRKDLVPRSGPLGGLYTGFRRHPSPWILFLACDMPLVRPAYLKKLVANVQMANPNCQAFTTKIKGKSGFPMILTRSTLPQIRAQLKTKDVSLRTLFKSLTMMECEPLPSEIPYLININHPSDLNLLETAI